MAKRDNLYYGYPGCYCYSGKVVIIQFVEGQKWAEMGRNISTRLMMVPANRGDILDSDGRILASSVPYYNIYMDTRSTGMDAQVHGQGESMVCREGFLR